MIEFQRLQQINNGKIQNLWAFISEKKEFLTCGSEGKKYTANVTCFNPYSRSLSYLAPSFIKECYDGHRDFSQSVSTHAKMKSLGLNVVDYYLANRNIVINPVMSGNGKVIIDRSENLKFMEYIRNGIELRNCIISQVGRAFRNDLLINEDGPAFIFDVDTNKAELMFLDLTSGVNLVSNTKYAQLHTSLLLNNSFIREIPDTFIDSPGLETVIPTGRPARAKIYHMIADQLAQNGKSSTIPITDCMQQLQTSESTVRRAVDVTKCCDVVNSRINFFEGNYGLDFFCGRCILSKSNHPENPLNGEPCPIRQTISFKNH